jgi:hypothetical protein
MQSPAARGSAVQVLVVQLPRSAIPCVIVCQHAAVVGPMALPVGPIAGLLRRLGLSVQSGLKRRSRVGVGVRWR